MNLMNVTNESTYEMFKNCLSKQKFHKFTQKYSPKFCNIFLIFLSQLENHKKILFYLQNKFWKNYTNSLKYITRNFVTYFHFFVPNFIKMFIKNLFYFSSRNFFLNRQFSKQVRSNPVENNLRPLCCCKTSQKYSPKFCNIFLIFSSQLENHKKILFYFPSPK